MRDRYRYQGYEYYDHRRATVHAPILACVDRFSRRAAKPEATGSIIQNSVNATLAHRSFCINLESLFPAYDQNSWGITASDSAKGYLAWGGPPLDPDIDGTLVPSAAGGSLMFTPELSLAALRSMNEKFGHRVYGRYGFVDAFNPQTGWFDTDLIGLHVVILLLSAEHA